MASSALAKWMEAAYGEGGSLAGSVPSPDLVELAAQREAESLANEARSSLSREDESTLLSLERPDLFGEPSQEQVKELLTTGLDIAKGVAHKYSPEFRLAEGMDLGWIGNLYLSNLPRAQVEAQLGVAQKPSVYFMPANVVTGVREREATAKERIPTPSELSVIYLQHQLTSRAANRAPVPITDFAKLMVEPPVRTYLDYYRESHAMNNVEQAIADVTHVWTQLLPPAPQIALKEAAALELLIKTVSGYKTHQELQAIEEAARLQETGQLDLYNEGKTDTTKPSPVIDQVQAEKDRARISELESTVGAQKLTIQDLINSAARGAASGAGSTIVREVLGLEPRTPVSDLSHGGGAAKAPIRYNRYDRKKKKKRVLRRESEPGAATQNMTRRSL